MTPELHATVTTLLRDIGQTMILPGFATTTARDKADGSVVTDIDIGVQARLRAELARLLPDSAFLGEEMPAEEQARALREAQSLWVLDPLDGTSNFVSGLPFFCISLAWVHNGTVRAGFVYDPVRDEMFSTNAEGSACLNGQPLPPLPAATPLKRSIAVVDFKRLPKPLAAALATAPPYRSQRSLGAVALEWCWLAAGRFQLYLHGGQKLWDYAAGERIFRNNGGAMTTLDGAMETIQLSSRSAVAASSAGQLREWTGWLHQQLS